MKNLKSEIDETLELSGMFGGGKLYEDKNGNPRFEGEDIKELLSGKLLSLFKQQMKEERKEIKIKLKVILKGIDKDEIEDENGWWETSTGVEFGRNILKKIDQLLKNIEGL